MKHFYTLFILLFSCSTCIAANICNDDDEVSKEIYLAYKENTFERDRSISFYSIEAWLNSYESNILIYVSGTKNTQFYIFNIYGDIINSSSSYCGDIETSIQLDVPDVKGKYFLVIESPIIYAEGTFFIN